MPPHSNRLLTRRNPITDYPINQARFIASAPAPICRTQSEGLTESLKPATPRCRSWDLSLSRDGRSCLSVRNTLRQRRNHGITSRIRLASCGSIVPGRGEPIQLMRDGTHGCHRSVLVLLLAGCLVHWPDGPLAQGAAPSPPPAP